MAMFGAGIRFPTLGAMGMPPQDPAQAVSPFDPRPSSMGPMDFPQATQQDMPTQRAAFEAPKRSFLDKLGLLADAFSGDSRNGQELAGRDAQAFQMWQQEQARQDAEATWQRREAAEAAQPRFFQNEVGDYVRYNPETNAAEVVYDGPEKPKTQTALEQQVALYRALNPQATDQEVAEIVKRGIAGAQYDPGVYKPMVDYKAQAARATKAMPSYANLHKAPPRPRAAPKPPAGFILD